MCNIYIIAVAKQGSKCKEDKEQSNPIQCCAAQARVVRKRKEVGES
jgi:hypothetical protein